MERMFRYIGLIQLSKLQLIEIFYFYIPELLMVCASTIVQRLIIKTNVIEEERSDTYVDIGNPETKSDNQPVNYISIAITIGKYELF